MFAGIGSTMIAAVRLPLRRATCRKRCGSFHGTISVWRA